MRPQRLGTREDSSGRRTLGKDGRRIGHLANEIEAAELEVARREQQSAGVHAGMHLQGLERRRQLLEVEAADLLVDIERGLDRAPAIVFRDIGIAELDERAIALRANDLPAVPVGDGAPDLQQFLEYLAILF